MRIAIVGNGKMGRAVAERAVEAGHEIVRRLGSRGNRGGAGITAEAMGGVDVAIEFTTPEAVLANLDRLTALRVPTVVGTTGWYDRLPEVRAWVEQRGAAVVYGANFAPGVQLLLLLAKQAGRLFAGRTEFDGFILEAHHRQKRDAPSGTALRLREAVRSADSSREYPVTSIRAGFVPGTHALSYDSPDETLTLRHEVRSRRVFAAGALVAAEWIVSRRGLFEFGEVIRESGRIGSPGQQGQEGEERQERQRRQERQNRQRRQ